MIVKKNIVYLGIDGPASPAQVRLEISGLKHAIKTAEEMIARLEQSMAIMDLKKEEILDEEIQKKSGEPKAGPEAQEATEEGGAVSGQVPGV